MTEQVNKKKLTKSDLIKTFLLWETQTEVCLSYERLMSLGFCISMSPVINRLYDTKEDTWYSSILKITGVHLFQVL